MEYKVLDLKMFSSYNKHDMNEHPLIKYAENVANAFYHGYKTLIDSGYVNYDIITDINFKETEHLWNPDSDKPIHYSFTFMMNSNAKDAIDVNVFLAEMIIIQFTMIYEKEEKKEED